MQDLLKCILNCKAKNHKAPAAVLFSKAHEMSPDYLTKPLSVASIIAFMMVKIVSKAEVYYEILLKDKICLSNKMHCVNLSTIKILKYTYYGLQHCCSTRKCCR